MAKAFLITPFSPERAGGEAPADFDAVQRCVKTAADAAGVDLVHPKALVRAGAIMDQVKAEIVDADVILAIITGQNANVFYELGLAMRPSILIARSKADVPFDIQHLRYWTYGGPGELETLAQRLEAAIRETLTEEHKRRSDRAVQHFASLAVYPLPRVDSVDPYDMLGVAWSDAIDEHALQRPPYIKRDVDQDMDRIVQAGGPMLVVGPAASGKTRSAYEALLRNVPSWQMIIPKRLGAPERLAELFLDFELVRGTPDGVVLWLNDVERFLGVSVLTPTLLATLKASGIVTIATLRDTEFRRLSDTDGEIVQAMRAVLSRAKRVVVSDRMTEKERVRASEQYPEWEFGIGIGESFIAGTELKQRFDLADSNSLAVIKAAIDWRRVGMDWPISGQHLRTLYWYYYRHLEPLRDVTVEGLEAGLQAAREPVVKYSAMLRRDDFSPDRECYSAPDYLVDYAEKRGDQILDDIWYVLSSQLPAEEIDYVTVGASAYSRGLKQAAANVWHKGTLAGSKMAACNLAVMFAEEGLVADAKAAFKTATDLGDIESWRGLGVLLQREGDLAEAKLAFRTGLEKGDSSAASNLGAMLAEEGDLEGARSAFEEGARHGNGQATANLARLLSLQGKIEEARKAYETRAC